MNPRIYSDNGIPVEITLNPADIHIAVSNSDPRLRPTLEERLARAYDENTALLKKYNVKEWEYERNENVLLLIIIALILLCTFCGSRWLVWEERAVRAGWTEVAR